MLLFELFPLFVTLVSMVAGVWLFVLNREADSGEHARRVATSPSEPSRHGRTHQTSTIE